MAREYTPEWYLERIAWIKASRRPISLSTDIIVGFPGETDDDFIETMDLLAKVQYDCVFAFKYSARPNTPALVMIDSIPDAAKSIRLQMLLDRQREIQRVNYSKQIGETVEVMVEGANPARGQIAGRSSQNKPVNFTTGAAHRAGAGELSSRENHRSLSKQSRGRVRLTKEQGTKVRGRGGTTK